MTPSHHTCHQLTNQVYVRQESLSTSIASSPVFGQKMIPLHNKLFSAIAKDGNNPLAALHQAI